MLERQRRHTNFERGRKSHYTAEEAVPIILHKITDRGLTCKLHLLQVRENATFCIDTGSYENWEDIKDNMNGMYTKVLRCCIWTVYATTIDGNIEFKTLDKKSVKLESSDQYHLYIDSKGE